MYLLIKILFDGWNDSGNQFLFLFQKRGIGIRSSGVKVVVLQGLVEFVLV